MPHRLGHFLHGLADSEVCGFLARGILLFSLDFNG
jgi:hypothetical protein